MFIGQVSEYLSFGALLALLPSFILAYIEYRVTGGYALLRRISYAICRGKGGRRAIFAFFGVVALILSVLFIGGMALGSVVLLSEGGAVEEIVSMLTMSMPLISSFIACGILFVLVSVFGKNPPPIRSNVKNVAANSNVAVNNTAEE